MRYPRADLKIVGGLALLACIIALLGGQFVLLRTLAALPLVFVLPGYAVVSVLYASRALGSVERALFSIGMSVVLAMLGGLVLHLLPWGLNTASWAVLLTVVTLAGCLVAARRPPELPWRTRRLRIQPASLALYATAVLIAVGAVALARREAQQAPPSDVVQLWMLPAAGAPGAPALRIGITSVGAPPTHYTLRLQRNGQLIHEWPEIQLAAGASWEVGVTSGLLGAPDQPFEALLFRADAPQTVFRRTLVWPGAQAPR